MKIWIIVALVIVVVMIMVKNSPFMTENFAVYSCGDRAGLGGATIPDYTNGDYSTCYVKKKIYLNPPTEDTFGHGEVILEKRFGKLYITINSNLPYVKGGVFNTTWGAYHAFMVDSSNPENSISLGSLVRHGDRFYKLTTELNGDYRGYDLIKVVRKTEDYPPVEVLTGSITLQQRSDH